MARLFANTPRPPVIRTLRVPPPLPLPDPVGRSLEIRMKSLQRSFEFLWRHFFFTSVYHLPGSCLAGCPPAQKQRNQAVKENEAGGGKWEGGKQSLRSADISSPLPLNPPPSLSQTSLPSPPRFPLPLSLSSLILLGSWEIEAVCGGLEGWQSIP